LLNEMCEASLDRSKSTVHCILPASLEMVAINIVTVVVHRNKQKLTLLHII
jgi:hypothetical protein